MQDMDYVRKLRGVKWEILYQLGRKIMNGQFNLTTISFPIKLCKPRTALENVLIHAIWNPIYMGLACRVTDPLERMKLIAV